MATITLGDLETRVRYLVQDIATSGSDFNTYTTSSIFPLSEVNVISVSSVLVNGDTSGVTYSYSSSTNKLTVTSSLEEGDTIEIQYSYYQTFSQNEIFSAIHSAIYHLSINNTVDFQVLSENNYVEPSPSIKQQNLISIIAGLILEPDNKSYRLPDINVIAPIDDPLHTKIRKVIGAYKIDKIGILTLIEPIDYI